MVKKLKLSAPLAVDGVDLKELSYDFELLTIRDLMAADKVSQGLDAHHGTVNMMAEFSLTIYLELFFKAVCKAMPNVTRMDLDRLAAKDGMVAGAHARNFFLHRTEAEDGLESE